MSCKHFNVLALNGTDYEISSIYIAGVMVSWVRVLCAPKNKLSEMTSQFSCCVRLDLQSYLNAAFCLVPLEYRYFITD